MYSGSIQGVGPRYCPSIEDKIVKFSDKARHQIFLEPEGLNDHTIYPNGISTSLPEVVQYEILNNINGLENVKVIRPGYAIEYDYIDPRELFLTLETKKLKIFILPVKLMELQVTRRQQPKVLLQELMLHFLLKTWSLLFWIDQMHI